MCAGFISRSMKRLNTQKNKALYYKLLKASAQRLAYTSHTDNKKCEQSYRVVYRNFPKLQYRPKRFPLSQRT